MSKKPAKNSRPAKGKSFRPTRRKSAHGNALTSIILVLPLFVFYELAVLSRETMNGADVITQLLLRWVGRNAFIGIQLTLIAIGLGVILYLRRKQRFQLRHVAPVLLESTVYALTMGTFIVFVMVDLLGVNPQLANSPLQTASVFDRLVIAVGAGVHEELIFRLVLVGGGIWLLQRVFGWRSSLAIVGSVTISSVLFAAAHHVGPLGEPWKIGALLYRSLAGIVFAVIYQTRGFATAVYTHTIYDIYVLLIR